MKRELLDNGNIWQKSDGRWIGMVRYKDEFGVAQRKSFSSKKKKTLQAKMTEYVKNFQEQIANSDESRKPLKESKKLLTKHMNNGYAFTTSKKAYSLLKMFFKQFYHRHVLL